MIFYKLLGWKRLEPLFITFDGIKVEMTSYIAVGAVDTLSVDGLANLLTD